MALTYAIDWTDESIFVTEDEYKAMPWDQKKGRSFLKYSQSSDKTRVRLNQRQGIPCMQTMVVVSHTPKPDRPHAFDGARGEVTYLPERLQPGKIMTRVSSLFVPGTSLFPLNLRPNADSSLPAIAKQTHGTPDKGDKSGRGPNGTISLKDGEIGRMEMWAKVRGDADPETKGREEAVHDDGLLMASVPRKKWIGIIEQALLAYDGSQWSEFYIFDPTRPIPAGGLSNPVWSTTVPNIFNDEVPGYIKEGFYAPFIRAVSLPLEKLHPLGTEFHLFHGPTAISFRDDRDMTEALSFVQNAFGHAQGDDPAPVEEPSDEEDAKVEGLRQQLAATVAERDRLLTTVDDMQLKTREAEKARDAAVATIEQLEIDVETFERDSALVAKELESIQQGLDRARAIVEPQ